MQRKNNINNKMLSSHECSLTRNLMGHEKKGKTFNSVFFSWKIEKTNKKN